MTTPPLQSSLQNQNASLSLSSSLCYSQSHASLVPTKRVSVCYSYKGGVSVTCSISKIHNYGTVDYERRPTVKWNALYKRISLMDNPELGSASVLNQWENEGKSLTKWELCRVVKELRKYKKHDRALQSLGSATDENDELYFLGDSVLGRKLTAPCMTKKIMAKNMIC